MVSANQSRFADKLRELHARKDEASLARLDELTRQYLATGDIDVDDLDAALTEAGPALFSDHRDRTIENLRSHFESELNEWEYARDCIGEVLAAKSVAAEHAELEAKESALIRELEDSLAPIRQRKSVTGAVLAKGDKSEKWLIENPRPPVRKAKRELLIEISKLERFITAQWSPITDREREYVHYMGEEIDGVPRYGLRSGEYHEKGQKALEAVLSRQREREQQKVEAAAKIEVIKAKRERLEKLCFVLWPSEAEIEAALQDEPMPELVKETASISITSDE